MSRIAFLIAETDQVQDGNYLRFANTLHERGHQVTLCFMESLGMAKSRVVASGCEVTDPIQPDEVFAEPNSVYLDTFDVVWILSLGMRQSFLDKMQLLFTLQEKCRLINSLDAIMHFKSKYFTASHADVFRHPETWASTHPDVLYEVMHSKGGKWIVKPPASSFGRNVYLLTADDPNARVILESMCGFEEDEFCLLQRYVEEIAQGEKRVLLAGGKPVGQYLRTQGRDHRTNVWQGANMAACELTLEERRYCEKIGQRLLSFGAEFVGMDLVFPWVIEFNVINPGGITTIEQLTGTDITSAIIDEVIA
jgi:glutathione synthase